MKIKIKSKKIMMIAILVVFLIVLGVIVIKINNKSIEKNEEIANANTSNTSTTISESISGGVIRTSLGNTNINTSNMIEITDNYFIQQTNDIYFNLEDYIGKTIKIEGLTYSYNDTNGDICYAVVRNAPGCCGDDGMAGLDIRYNGEYPEIDTWIEIVGVMGRDTVYGSEIPAIQVVSLKEKETPATTFVSN